MPPALVATSPPIVAWERAARSTPKSSPAARACRWTLSRVAPAPTVTCASTLSTGSSSVSRGQGEQHGTGRPGRYAAADQSGVSALRHDRYPRDRADAEHSGYFGGRAGADHAAGPAGEAARPVDLVRRPQVVLDQHVVRTDSAGQLGLERAGGDGVGHDSTRRRMVCCIACSFASNLVGVVDADVGEQVAQLVAGTQQLHLDVHRVLGEDAVDLGQYARGVGVDVHQPVAARRYRQRQRRQVDRQRAVALVAERVELVATNAPMSACASSVEPPMCWGEDDVGQPAQLRVELVAAPLGLLGKTSTAAPERCPLTSTSRSATWSMTKPRDRFQEDAAPGASWRTGRRRRSRSCPGRPSTCRVTTSAWAQQLSRLSQRWALPSASRSAVS